MDTNTLATTIKARYDHAIARQTLKEKYQAKMVFAYNGGLFTAGPSLQTTLLTCPDETAVIIDMHDVPIKVNTHELLKLSQERWQEQMNAWLDEYNETSKQR